MGESGLCPQIHWSTCLSPGSTHRAHHFGTLGNFHDGAEGRPEVHLDEDEMGLATTYPQPAPGKHRCKVNRRLCMGLCGASVRGRGRLSVNWHIWVLVVCTFLPSFTQSGNTHHCPLNARLSMSTNDKCKLKETVSLIAQLSDETRIGWCLEESTYLGKQRGTNRAGAPAMHHMLPGALFMCYINNRNRV